MLSVFGARAYPEGSDGRRQNDQVSLSKKGVVAVFLLGLVLMTAMPSHAQGGLISEKYLKIIPGVSTRADVERIYSKSDPKSHFVDYETSDFSVGIKYSSGPCELGVGVWGLPEWTVEEVFYDWPEGKRIRLSHIVLDRTRFVKRELGDVVGDDYYVNDEWGVSVVYGNKLKSVSTIRIRPSAELKEKYSCWKDKIRNR